MKLTREHFNEALSSNGGYSQKQLKLLKVNIKKSGWKYRAMAKDYPPEVIQKFIDLKDAHLVDGQNVFQRGEMKLPERWKRLSAGDPDDTTERLDYQIHKPERAADVVDFLVEGTGENIS